MKNLGISECDGKNPPASLQGELQTQFLRRSNTVLAGGWHVGQARATGPPAIILLVEIVVGIRVTILARGVLNECRLRGTSGTPRTRKYEEKDGETTKAPGGTTMPSQGGGRLGLPCY